MGAIKYFSRLSNAPLYIDIALGNYNTATEAKKEIARVTSDTTLEEVERNYITSEYEEVRHKHSVTTVVFASMAIEAYIYDYSAREMSDKFTRTYLDKLDIVSKWVLIPKLVTSKDFPIERQGFQLMKELFGYRNKLVHFKSTNFTPEKLEDLQESTVDSYEMATKALEALIQLSSDMETIDSEEPVKFMFSIDRCIEALKTR